MVVRHGLDGLGVTCLPYMVYDPVLGKCVDKPTPLVWQEQIVPQELPSGSISDPASEMFGPEFESEVTIAQREIEIYKDQVVAGLRARGYGVVATYVGASGLMPGYNLVVTREGFTWTFPLTVGLMGSMTVDQFVTQNIIRNWQQKYNMSLSLVTAAQIGVPVHVPTGEVPYEDPVVTEARKLLTTPSVVTGGATSLEDITPTVAKVVGIPEELKVTSAGVTTEDVGFQIPSGIKDVLTGEVIGGVPNWMLAVGLLAGVMIMRGGR